jgi:cyclin-dependent kinase 9
MLYVRDPSACELLDLLLVLDPKKRYNSDAALNYDFFWTDPVPCDLSV